MSALGTMAQRRGGGLTVDLVRLELLTACIAVFFAPFHVLRVEVFYFTLSDGFMCLSLLLRLRLATLPRDFLGVATGGWFLGLLVLMAALLVGSLVQGDPMRGIIVVGQYLFAFLVLPLVIVNRPYRESALLVKVFVGAIFVICAFGIFLYLSGAAKGTSNAAFITGNGRMASFVETPNTAASLIAMTFPLLFYLSLAQRLASLVVVALFAVLGFGLLLTGSNTGMFAATAAVGIFVVARASTRLILTVGVVLAAVTIAVTTWGTDILPPVFQQRVLGALQSGDLNEAGTFTGRYDLIKEAFEIVDGTMLLGLGADQYRIVSEDGAPVHNVYLLLWAEGGLPALAGFVLVLISGLFLAWSARGSPEGRLVMTTGMTTLLVFAALVNATPHVYARHWVTPVFLALGLAQGFTRSRRDALAMRSLVAPLTGGSRTMRLRPFSLQPGDTP